MLASEEYQDVNYRHHVPALKDISSYVQQIRR